MALPAHTSDHLLPLDVSVFGPLKYNVDQFIEEASAEARKVCSSAALGVISVEESIYKGNGNALTEKNVKSGFKNYGLRALNAASIFVNCIRRSFTSKEMVSEGEESNVLHNVLQFKCNGFPPARTRG